MVRIFRAIKLFNADLKSNPVVYRKLFGVYFAVSLVIFIISTLISLIFNGGLIGKSISGYIDLLLMFILFHAFFSDSKSYVLSAKEIKPRILKNLAVILFICIIPIDIWNLFRTVYSVLIDSEFFSSMIVGLISSIVAIFLLVYEFCLLIFAAENTHEKVGTMLFGGLSLMKKLFFPIFILLIFMTLLTLALTGVLIAPFIPLGGGSIDFENISTVIVNIISISLTFLYTGIFVKLRTDT